MKTTIELSDRVAQREGTSLRALIEEGLRRALADRRIRRAGFRMRDVTVAAGEQSRRLSSGEITRIRARHSDSVFNGALIGAAAGVASGLFLCRLTEPWEVCRGDEGSMLRIGALGAGIGIGVDLLIRGRKTIYQRPGSGRVHIAPLFARTTAGMQVAFRF